MREHLLLLVVAGAAACAAQSAPSTLITRSTPIVSYSCASHEVTRDAGKVYAGGEAHLPLGWQDTDGDHFVAWPVSATAREAVEYVMPSDRRASAIERIYDTTKGRSRADWRIKQQTVCLAKGGYADALARFSSGQSIDELAREFDVDRRDARSLVHGALMKALADYHRQYR